MKGYLMTVSMPASPVRFAAKYKINGAPEALESLEGRIRYRLRKEDVPVSMAMMPPASETNDGEKTDLVVFTSEDAPALREAYKELLPHRIALAEHNKIRDTFVDGLKGLLEKLKRTTSDHIKDTDSMADTYRGKHPYANFIEDLVIMDHGFARALGLEETAEGCKRPVIFSNSMLERYDRTHPAPKPPEAWQSFVQEQVEPAKTLNAEEVEEALDEDRFSSKGGVVIPKVDAPVVPDCRTPEPPKAAETPVVESEADQVVEEASQEKAEQQQADEPGRLRRLFRRLGRNKQAS